MNIAEEFIEKVASNIKESIKTYIGDIYPNINYVGNKGELITAWYIKTLTTSCNQAIENCQVKHASIGMFYNKHTQALINMLFPEYYACISYNIFDQVITESPNNRSLFIKIVDDADNIYLYSASSKLSTYDIVNINEEMNNIFEYITHISIISDKDDPIYKNINSFAHDISKELKNVFNVQYTYNIYCKAGLIKIIFSHTTLDRVIWKIEMNIELAFTIYNAYQIIKEYTVNRNLVDIMKRYMHIYTNIADMKIPLIDIGEYSNKFNTYANILNYIGSATHLLNPLWESLLSMLSDKYNELKWFVHAAEMLEKNPNYSFENFFTTVKYNANEKELSTAYLSIYDK